MVKPVDEMTANQKHNEIMNIIVQIINGVKDTPALRHRLADLTGMKCVARGEKPPVNERDRYITCADLKTPDSRKRLIERIIGKKICVTPVSKTGRKQGSVDKAVLDRQRERTEEFLHEREKRVASQAIYYSQMRDDKEYDSELKSVTRDVTKGLYNLDNALEQKFALDIISKSLAEIYARHWNK